MAYIIIPQRAAGCVKQRYMYVWNALVDMYAKCGQVEQARWLFDRMVNKNVVSWNLMISGYLKHGKPDECIGLFRERALKVQTLKLC